MHSEITRSIADLEKVENRAIRVFGCKGIVQFLSGWSLTCYRIIIMAIMKPRLGVKAAISNDQPPAPARPPRTMKKPLQRHALADPCLDGLSSIAEWVKVVMRVRVDP